MILCPRRLALVALTSACLLAFSCNRASAPAEELRRVAVLPANVLIDDSSRNWMGLACSIVLQYDLATSRSLLPLFATDSSSAYLSGAGEMLISTLDSNHTRLRLATESFSLSTHRTTPLLDSSVDSTNGILEPLDRLAHQLDPRNAQPFSTHNPAALQSFVEAVSASSPQVRTQRLQQAVELDARFGLAQLALLETAGPFAAQGVHPEQFSPLDRARWEAAVARIERAPQPTLIQRQQAVLRVAPNSVEALATLGTFQFLSGNRQEGERQLRRAIALNPANLALQLELQQLQQSAKAAPNSKQ